MTPKRDSDHPNMIIPKTIELDVEHNDKIDLAKNTSNSHNNSTTEISSESRFMPIDPNFLGLFRI